MTANPLVTAQDVLAFWREAGEQRWFTKDAAFDTEVNDRFAHLLEDAKDGRLNSWKDSDEGLLALIVVLDQFPRNIYRNDARAFATDSMARQLTHEAIARGADQRIDLALRAFVYMPLMHSESLTDQEHSVALYRALGNANNLKFAQLHADIIRKYGRFPHRNAVLGRATTPEEATFLAEGGFAG